MTAIRRCIRVLLCCCFGVVLYGARIWTMPVTAAGLDIPLTVKEIVTVDSAAYPISVVIPLPRGQFMESTALGISGLPSQVEVLERWPDRSLRHVLVHFQPTVSAGGTATYHFTDGGQNAPPVPVTVNEQANGITVQTGPLQFTVNKLAFSLFDQLWLDQNGNGAYEDSERIITPNNQNGGLFQPRAGAGATQYDRERSDLTVTIEERGPLRAVIRVEAPTIFNATTDHQHGFAVRIYAYAGKPFVKVDYQLQNSARVVRAWPLYFDAMNVDFRLNLAANPTLTFGAVDDAVVQTTAPAYLAQERHDQYQLYQGPAATPIRTVNALAYNTIAAGAGFVDVSDGARGVMAVTRNFWQMWPNGLAVDAQNKLSVQLFPAWSAQWQGGGSGVPGTLSPTGLYWLKDMQHVYKEMLFFFHGAKPADNVLAGLAKTFQFQPVAVLPTDWYRQTQATLDLGGVLPPASAIPSAPDLRRPDAYWSAEHYAADHAYYAANWRNFGEPETGYRVASCTTGGTPHSANSFVATGNPSDYFLAELWAIGELNVRPQWMAQYQHERDSATLHLTENPYCGGTWRIFEGHGIPVYAAPLLAGTEEIFPDFGARDDQHGWFYHVAEAYFYTGNPWIKDWYQFIAQFRRTRLRNLDPFRDTSSRATAHALGHAVQAYRISGDEALLGEWRDYVRTYLRPEQDPLYGDQLVDDGGFQIGYLMRTMIAYLEAVRGKNNQMYAEAFNYLAGLMAWNLYYGNFAYYFHAEAGGQGASAGTGLTLVDPQAWYYWHTGKPAYWQQIEDFLDGGINGGEVPYGNFANWQGQYEGRYYQFVKNTPRTDTTPPPAITNATATWINANQVLLQWTAPADAARYHIVWSTKPIVENQSLAANVSNWWAANAVGPDLAPIPGQAQSLTFEVNGATPVYVALFTFDQAENMSAMSNVAQAQTGSITPTPTVTVTPTHTPTPTATPPIGNVRHLYPGNSFEAAVESLAPGDTLLVHQGDYSDSGRISIQVLGSGASPVVIMGAPGEARPRILRLATANAQNTINIEGASYLTIQGLEITSNGGDGIKLFHANNQHITLADLVIHDVDVGINVQQSAHHLIIRRVHIYNTATNGATGAPTGGSGEGMYLGCHDGSCVVADSTIENNWVHDTRAGSQGDGIELKVGSYANVLRDNVIYNTNYPCILLYGTNGNTRNLVEGNVMWNCTEGGIQAAADAIIRNNLVFDSGIGFNSVTHNGVIPQNLDFVHNTLVNANPCLNIRDWNNRSGLRFANNAIYCATDTLDVQGGTTGAIFAGNVVYPAAAALPAGSYRVGRGPALDFINVASHNFYPAATSAMLDTGNATYAAATDFNGTARTGSPETGAYTWTQNDNPGWAIQVGFKGDGLAPTPTPTPTPTGDSTLIFADGFESGNLNRWSARRVDGGDLNVSTAATLAGRFGMVAQLDDNNTLYVTDDQPNGETGYQVRFRVDPNTISMANGDQHALFYGYSGAATPVLRLELRFAAGRYQLRTALRNDATTWTNSAWFTISDAPHILQLNWRPATATGANDGRLAFRIDSVLKFSVIGVDNDTRRIDRVRLGAVAGIDSGTRGSYFFDAFQANRTVTTAGATAADVDLADETAEDSTVFIEEVTAEELADEAAEAPVQQLFLPFVVR